MSLRSAPFLLLVLAAVAVRERRLGYTNTLKYLHIVISEPSRGQPHYISLGYVNDQLFSYYDSNSRKVQPPVSWMEKVGKDDPQYWNRSTELSHDKESLWRSDLILSRNFYSETEGLHVIQDMEGCVLRGDGSKRAFDQTAYNGEMSLAWDDHEAVNEYHEECIEWLEKYLSYRKDTLLRTEPPVVMVSSRTEEEDGMETHVCRVHGFYSKEIYASWRRDGEIWLQDTLHGSVAPNADGTYYYWLSIQIDPKERGRYRCYVKYNSLEEPVVLPLTESNLGLIIGCVVAGLIVVFAIAGILVFLWSNQAI